MKFFIHTFLRILLVALVITIFTLCFAPVHWLADLASHFMLQYVTLSGIVFAGLCLMRARRWQIILSGFVYMIFSLQVGCLFIPRHIIRSDVYEDVTILQFNINYSNPNADAIAGWINNYATINSTIDRLTQQARPDIVVLQEVSPDIAAKLTLLTETFPYHFIAPKEGAFGVAVFSRIPIRDSVRKHFADSWNEYTEIHFHTLAQGITFNLTELHAMPPAGKQNSAQRNAELKEITVVTNQQGESSKILIGDMNITPYSPWFWQMERSTRLNNSMQGKAVAGTWPSFLPALLRIPIDHVLVSDNIEVLERLVEKSHDSDHLPVVTKLRIYATN